MIAALEDRRRPRASLIIGMGSHRRADGDMSDVEHRCIANRASPMKVEKSHYL